MQNEKIDNLFQFIESTANSIKILAETDLPQVKEVLYENTPLIEGCPSRASAAVFALRGIKERSDEIMELINTLETEIFDNYSDVK